MKPFNFKSGHAFWKKVFIRGAQLSKNFLIIFSTLLILATNDAIATTVLFLPGSWEGPAPKFLEGTGEKPFELARIAQFYASNGYALQVREEFSSSLNPEAKEYLVPSVPRDKFKQNCNRTKVDYVVRDVLEIQEKIRIDRSVYDCNLFQMQEYSATGKRDLFETYERLTRDSFPLVPKKKKKDTPKEQTSPAPRIQVFVLDAAYSYAPERKEFMSQLEAISWRPETKFRLVVAGAGNSKVYPESSRSEFFRQWKDFKSEGKTTTEDLSNALLRLKRVLSSEETPGRRKQYGVTILTNAKNSDSGRGYGAAIESLKQSSANISILYSSYSGPEARREHKEAAKRGAEFREIVYYQRIVTPRDAKTLVYRNGKLYTTSQTADSAVNLEESDLEKVELSGKYSLGDALNPWGLASIYSEIKNERILSSEPVRSNFSSQFAKVVHQNSNSEYFANYPKLLMKSGAKAFWIRIPSPTGFVEGKKGIWRVRFLSSAFSSEGVEVIPDSVEQYPYAPARTLECDPSVARNYFQNTEKSDFDCLIRGEILELSLP